MISINKIIRDLFKNSNTRSNPIAEPSQHLIDFVGGGDYKQVGDSFVDYFINLCDLKPTDKVLDLGCGFGRMAIPLTRYISNEGSYIGLDVSKECIDWGTAHITRLYPNFTFKSIDIWNKTYNPEGKIKGDDYKFPFKDNTVDFIFLTSVFTHMVADEMQNYLTEISRVLRPGGKCLITFFLLNPDASDHIERQLSTFQFRYQIDRCKIEFIERPQDVVGYEESYIMDLAKSKALPVISIHYGSWCGRKQYLSFQDIVILQKSMEN